MDVGRRPKHESDEFFCVTIQKTSQIPPRGRVAARCYQREAPHARGVLKFSTYCYTNLTYRTARMSTSRGSSNGDATRRDSKELGVEASTPPSTAHTHQADRSRSADRHAAHGNEARDERRPDRIPRQPNIDRSAVEASAVEASAVEASPTKEMQEDTIVRQPPDETAVNTDSGAAAMARMEAINASNMSLTYGGVGTGGIAGAEGTVMPPLPNTPICRRPRSTRRRIDTSRCMEAWVGSRCSNSRGYAYQDMHVHQLHVEVITLSQFHICMSHV